MQLRAPSVSHLRETLSTVEIPSCPVALLDQFVMEVYEVL